MCLFTTEKSSQHVRNWDDPPRAGRSKWQDAQTVTLPSAAAVRRSESTHRRRSRSRVRYESTAQIVRRAPSREVVRKVSRDVERRVSRDVERDVYRRSGGWAEGGAGSEVERDAYRRSEGWAEGGFGRDASREYARRLEGPPPPVAREMAEREVRDERFLEYPERRSEGLFEREGINVEVRRPRF